MIIYFTEEDLVSFGNYMVSAQRRKSFDQTQPGTGTLEERLSQVHDSDLTNWAYLQSTYAQIDKEVNNPDKVQN